MKLGRKKGVKKGTKTKQKAIKRKQIKFNTKINQIKMLSMDCNDYLCVRFLNIYTIFVT